MAADPIEGGLSRADYETLTRAALKFLSDAEQLEREAEALKKRAADRRAMSNDLFDLRDSLRSLQDQQVTS